MGSGSGIGPLQKTPQLEPSVEEFHSIVDDHGIGTMEDLCDDHLLSDHDLTTDVGMDAEQIEAFRAAISVVQEN